MGHEFTCVGEISLDYVLKPIRLPNVDETIIVDGAIATLGGPALNIGIYLAQLGNKARLAGVVGDDCERLVRTCSDEYGLAMDDLLFLEGSGDVLIILAEGSGYRSLFLRSQLSEEAATGMMQCCRVADALVVAGSRHSEIRQQQRIIRGIFKGNYLVFVPSYAVFVYDREELADVLQAADIVVMNDQENDFVLEYLRLQDQIELQERFSTSVLHTRGASGASYYSAEGIESVPSLAGHVVDPLGAGDGLVAGFVHKLTNGSSIRDSLVFGSALAALIVESATPLIRASHELILDRVRQIQ